MPMFFSNSYETNDYSRYRVKASERSEDTAVTKIRPQLAVSPSIALVDFRSFTEATDRRLRQH